MDKCKECGMPIDDKTTCECSEEKCVHCCSCDADCECGCTDKSKKDLEAKQEENKNS